MEKPVTVPCPLCGKELQFEPNDEGQVAFCDCRGAHVPVVQIVQEKEVRKPAPKRTGESS